MNSHIEHNYIFQCLYTKFTPLHILNICKYNENNHKYPNRKLKILLRLYDTFNITKLPFLTSYAYEYECLNHVVNVPLQRERNINNLEQNFFRMYCNTKGVINALDYNIRCEFDIITNPPVHNNFPELYNIMCEQINNKEIYDYV